MKVKIKQNISGNAGLYRKGKVYDMKSNEADYMIKEGFAKKYKDKNVSKSDKGVQGPKRTKKNTK